MLMSGGIDCIMANCDGVVWGGHDHNTWVGGGGGGGHVTRGSPELFHAMVSLHQPSYIPSTGFRTAAERPDNPNTGQAWTTAPGGIVRNHRGLDLLLESMASMQSRVWLHPALWPAADIHVYTE